ncbi:unnamed protein product [Tuber aestivum]|uniref:Uncharacterized protein n=1 Tax=Tuber aestivum TaxID=59557 RepID=A0A292PNF2_9PEZI|nr:unnamed protein product [Tuber aestivum]
MDDSSQNPAERTPPQPAPVNPISSSQRRNSSHVRPTIILKRKSNIGPTDQSEKPVETTKSYAQMVTKAIKSTEAPSASLDRGGYDEAFPSLGTEPTAKVTSPDSAGPVKPPISTRKAEGHKKDFVPFTPDNSNKAQAPSTLIPHRRNISHGGSREIRNQYIPRQVARSVSFGGGGKPHFGLAQGAARKVSPFPAQKVRGQSSGHHNPPKSYIEGSSAGPGEEKEGHRFHNPPTQPANFGGYRGSLRRHSSYTARGRGRSPTSPRGAPPGGLSWRHESWLNRKKSIVAHTSNRIDEISPPEKPSPVSPVGGKPAGATTGASDITRQALEHSTDETSLERGPEEEGAESPTPSPGGRGVLRPESGHQGEMGPVMQTPIAGTVSVAKDRTSPFSSGSPTVGPRGDDTSALKSRDTRKNAQQLDLQSSAPPPPPPPALNPPTSNTFRRPDPPGFLPPVFVLPPIPSYLQSDIGSNKNQENTSPMSHQTEQAQRPKLSADEYFGLHGHPSRPLNTAELLASISATLGDKRATTGIADTMADINEREGPSGPSKAVQYAPTVQDKASKALSGHEKVNFGDMDSKKAALASSQAASGNSAFNSSASSTDQQTLLAIYSPEVRLPPGPTQPPPGIPLPPGLPIPASYYQQQSITPQTGPGDISFSQPREKKALYAQPIDNPQPPPGQYRQPYPAMGPFTVGQRSNDNDSYLDLGVTDTEIKVINETFQRFGQTDKEETPSLTDRYGRRGAVSGQGGSSKGCKPAGFPGNLKAIGKDNPKDRFEEVFGAKGKVSIEVLQGRQKEVLVAERIRNERLAAEDGEKIPETVTGNTGLFPYPTHGKSDSETTKELLVEAFKQLSSYIDDKGVINDPATGENVKPSAYRAGPWKKPPAGETLDWISDDNTSFFDQSFGKDFVAEGKQTAGGGSPSNKPVIYDVKLKQTVEQGGARNTGGSSNPSAGGDLAAKDKRRVYQGQDSKAPCNVIFGPPKPPGYPNHMPREHLRPLKTFEPFKNDYPKVRYGLLPPNPRSINTAEKPYINHRGGAVGPVADSAPRYVYGPKGYLELAKDIPPPPPADPSPFSQPKVTPSPFAALEQALGTTRFTQLVPQHSRLEGPKPPPGAKPTGGLVTDTINGLLRVNYGGKQTQLDPDGSGLSRSEILKRKQRPGSRIGINFDGSNGMEFDIDKTDFNPAEHNTLGGKFKLKSQLRREQEVLRAQLPQQSQQSGGAQPATHAKGIPVQGGSSGPGSGTRLMFDVPPGGGPRPVPSTPGNWAAQGIPEAKRGVKGWNSGMGGR